MIAELGQDISKHRQMTFEEIKVWEDLAHHKALSMSNTGRWVR